MYDRTKKFISWLNTKVFLNEKYNANTMAFRNLFTPRGHIYTCHLGENIGDEKCGKGRPVLIVSNDSANRKNSNVIVVTLSKNIKYVPNSKVLKFKSHYVLSNSKYTKLAFDSCVQTEDIKVISKSRLGKHICSIDKTDMNAIKKRLKYSLDI